MTIHIGSKALLVLAAVALLGVAAAASGLIPLSQLLWLGLVLICPLMMFFMMRGMHGSHEDHEQSAMSTERSKGS
jgi:Protein of unknown function (DUF2933)